MLTEVAARWRVAVLPACFALGVFLSEASAETSPASIWETNVAAACLRARSEQKPLVVYLLASDGAGPPPSYDASLEEAPTYPALDGFRDWAVLVKVDPRADLTDDVARGLSLVLPAKEIPAVAVVEPCGNDWKVGGVSEGHFEDADFIRILRADIARAMIGICRYRYTTMSTFEAAEAKEAVLRRCDQARPHSAKIAKAYDAQLARLESEGQFSASAFAAAADERQQQLQNWIALIAEFAALPEYEDDPLWELILNAALFDYDLNRRLEHDLKALSTADRLQDARTVERAQAIVEAMAKEREAESEKIQKIISQAGQTRHGRSAGHEDMAESGLEGSQGGTRP